MTGLPASERPVLLLGAGSDIALALAHDFGAAGHPLQLAARRPETLETAKRDLEIRYRVPVSLHAFDALDIDKHRDFMQGLDPTPHIVISAIGLLGEQKRQEIEPRAAELVMRTNYIGPALALEAAAGVLAKLDAPTAIVGISSVAGERGRAKNYYYGSAKAAFSQFLSGLRQRLARSNVHVVIVKPGLVATKMTDGMNMPSFLTADPADLSKLIAAAVRKRRHDVFGWKWYLVALVVRTLPNALFKRMRF